MARTRFPADEFGMDFHISHLQFYQPEASESDDDEGGGGGGGRRREHVDLEVALQLSMGKDGLLLIGTSSTYLEKAGYTVKLAVLPAQ